MIFVLFSYFVYFHVLKKKIRIVAVYKKITVTIQDKCIKCTKHVQVCISHKV